MAFVTHSLESALLYIRPCRAASVAVFSWASSCLTASRRLPSHCALLDFLHRASTKNAFPLSVLSLSLSIAVSYLYVQRFSDILRVRQRPCRFCFCRSSVVLSCPRLSLSSIVLAPEAAQSKKRRPFLKHACLCQSRVQPHRTTCTYVPSQMLNVIVTMSE